MEHTNVVTRQVYIWRRSYRIGVQPLFRKGILSGPYQPIFKGRAVLVENPTGTLGTLISCAKAAIKQWLRLPPTSPRLLQHQEGPPTYNTLSPSAPHLAWHRLQRERGGIVLLHKPMKQNIGPPPAALSRLDEPAENQEFRAFLGLILPTRYRSQGCIHNPPVWRAVGDTETSWAQGALGICLLSPVSKPALRWGFPKNFQGRSPYTFHIIQIRCSLKSPASLWLRYELGTPWSTSKLACQLMFINNNY